MFFVLWGVGTGSTRRPGNEVPSGRGKGPSLKARTPLLSPAQASPAQRTSFGKRSRSPRTFRSSSGQLRRTSMIGEPRRRPCKSLVSPLPAPPGGHLDRAAWRATWSWLSQVVVSSSGLPKRPECEAKCILRPQFYIPWHLEVVFQLKRILLCSLYFAVLFPGAEDRP